MKEAVVLVIARCPMDGKCLWRSEPCTTGERALEAQRAHVNGHSHSDLVAFICSANQTISFDNYSRDPAVADGTRGMERGR